MMDEDITKILTKNLGLSEEKLQAAQNELDEQRSRGDRSKTIVDILIQMGELPAAKVCEALHADGKYNESFPPDVRKVCNDKKLWIGKHILVRKLAVGGSGTVYKAYDAILKRYLAIKFLTDVSDEGIKRFKREAEVVANLSHPNIAQVYDVGNHNGKYFIAMQFIDGTSLDKLIGTLDSKSSCVLAVKVCEALKYAHDMGVIHRDIKPSNIMIDKKRQVYLMDFGIARVVDVNFTQTRYMLGTPRYMSPEQADEKKVDKRTDIYSLGATLYHLVTGRTVYEGDSFTAIIDNLLNNDPIPPRKVKSDIPQDLELIIMKCLSREPEKRYNSADELGTDIIKYLNSEPIKARRPSSVYLFVKKLKKYRIHIAIATAVFITTFLFTLPLYLTSRSESRSNSLFSKAMESEQKGNYDKAINLYTNLLGQYPDHAGSHFRLATILMKQEQYEGAREHLKKYTSLRPDDAQAFNLLGISCVRSKKEDEAIDCFVNALRVNPEYHDAASNLGTLYMDKGEYETALRYLEKAIENSNPHPQALHNTGIAYYNLGKYEEAIDYIKQSLEANPGSAQDHFILGVSSFKLQRFEESITSLQKAISLSTDHFESHFYAARAYEELKDYDSAVKYYTKSLDINPLHFDSLVNLGTLHAVNGDLTLAEELFNRAIEADPLKIEPYVNLGKLEGDRSDLDKAIKYLKKALEIKPDHVYATFLLGVMYMDSKNLVDAEGCFKKTIDLDQGYEPAYSILGTLYQMQQKKDEALEYYLKALRINPNNILTNKAAAGIFMEHGKHKKAIELIKCVIAGNPNDSTARFYLALCYLKIGEEESAIKEYEALLKLDNKLAQELKNYMGSTTKKMNEPF